MPLEPSTMGITKIALGNKEEPKIAKFTIEDYKSWGEQMEINNGISVWEYMKLLIQAPTFIFRLEYYIIRIYFLITLYKRQTMTQDKVSTLKGIADLAAVALSLLGVTVTPENSVAAVGGVMALWGIVKSILGKISNSKHITPV